MPEPDPVRGPDDVDGAGGADDLDAAGSFDDGDADADGAHDGADDHTGHRAGSHDLRRSAIREDDPDDGDGGGWSGEPPRAPRRPLLPGGLPEALTRAGPDPAVEAENAAVAAEGTARALVLAGHADPAEAERLVRLTDEVGLDELASLWSKSEAGSLPAALWTLFVLQAWCHRAPLEVARLAAAGRAHADVSATIAGLPAEVSREEVVALADDLLRGALSRDLSTSLERAAALCRVLATGRGVVPTAAAEDPWAQPLLGARLLTTAEGLERTAAAERA